MKMNKILIYWNAVVQQLSLEFANVCLIGWVKGAGMDL